MIIKIEAATDELISKLRGDGFRVVGGTFFGELVIIARKDGVA